MTDTALSETLTAAARAAGVDLVGVAHIERFDEVAPEHHPAGIFPETRSAIVLAKRVTRGCLRGVEEGTQFGLFATYARNWVPHRFLAYATVGVASVLEDAGWEAVPLPNLPPETPPMGIPVGADRPAPNVMIDFTDAAVRAGLGEIGLSGELMTPQFGHRQCLTLILTDADLSATELFDGQVCDRCGACAAACPFEAIDTGATEARTICGTAMTVARIDEALCRRCRNGALPNPSHPSGKTDRMAALCMRSCTCLTDPAKLDRAFANPFRRRPAWRIGPDGVPALVEEGRS